MWNGASRACVVGLILLVGRGWASGADTSVPDRLVIEEPTFVCLGVEWFVKGDDNGNATVEFCYRKAGEADWREAMPLWRVDSTGRIRKVPEGEVLFAGSIFGLEQGTKYEMKLSLKDPDGGNTEKIVGATTRTEPVIPENMRQRWVVPGDGGGSGTKDDPFKGLKVADAAAQPGDIFNLAAGTYKGPVAFMKSGAEGKPIVWRGPADNSAAIDGGGAERGVSAIGVSHVWLWHLSVGNAAYAVVAHQSSYIVMRHCRVYDTDNGFTATRNPMKGIAVLDNDFDGWVPWRIDGKRVCYPNTIFRFNGKRYDVTDVLAVNVSGEGSVVAFNRMKAWGDGIHGSGDQPKCANDLYGNEISDCGDDGIECDEGAQNIRCFGNRITNCFQGISTQPLHGGPCYIFRNALYNTNYEPFKLHNSPHGVLLINNTSVRSANEGGPEFVHTSDPVFHVWAGNNLFAGGNNGYALEMSPKMTNCAFDYNGYAGGPFASFAKWNGVIYKTLADFEKEARQEEHGIVMPVKGLFASGVMPPESPDKPVDVSANNLLLDAGAKAVDAGYNFPGITDGYKGEAPDLGAYELGTTLPHYGPRPEE